MSTNPTTARRYRQLGKLTVTFTLYPSAYFYLSLSTPTRSEDGDSKHSLKLQQQLCDSFFFQNIGVFKSEAKKDHVDVNRIVTRNPTTNLPRGKRSRPPFREQSSPESSEMVVYEHLDGGVVVVSALGVKNDLLAVSLSIAAYLELLSSAKKLICLSLSISLFPRTTAMLMPKEGENSPVI